MGILNITPDSFSDGGELYSQGQPSLEKTVDRAAQMIANGAHILDIGAESSRPGASPVSEQQELDRLVPVLEALCARFESPISVDTSTPKVIDEAAAIGVNMINDIRALARDGAVDAVAKSGLPVCLMHMQGDPSTMQNAPAYDNVGDEVLAYLLGRTDACVAAGIALQNIIIDPGFGFGKTLSQNLQLFKALPKLTALGLPVLVGVSRKSMIGHITGQEVNDRVIGSAVAAALAVRYGASIIRTHDIIETKDAIAVAQTLG